MYRSNSARIVPLIIFAVVAVALIFGLVTVGRYIFGGNQNADEQTIVDQSKDELLTVNVDRSVRMTIRGPIVADEEFQSIEINVAPAQRTYTEYTGYRASVEKRERFSNNTPAYEEFVYALDKAAFTSPGKFTGEEASDIRGICATGQVYEFELFDGQLQLQRYWTSTCKGSPGTLGASATQLTSLFSAQIPDIDLGRQSSFRRF